MNILIIYRHMSKVFALAYAMACAKSIVFQVTGSDIL